MVAVINVAIDAHAFLAFSDLNCHLEDKRMGVFGCTVLPDSKETHMYGLAVYVKEGFPFTYLISKDS